jgi:hypothetical protein
VFRAKQVKNSNGRSRLRREQEPGAFVFTTERGGPMTSKGFHSTISRLGQRAGCRSRFTRTCCVTRAGTRWRIAAWTLERCRRGWDTGTSSTRCAMRSWRPSAFGTSGRTR